MRGCAKAVDDVLTMTSTLLSQQQLEHLFPTAGGRFGRQLKTIAWADPETAPTRTTTVWRMRERMKSSDFRIDPLVVSGAIVERMFAGHAL